jgi:membrane-bound metal-dependent hydrolase YbcI (DUF457 family)
MPLPVGHGVIGASLFSAAQRNISFTKDGSIMLLCAGLAIIPDFDFLLTWIFNLPGWHRGFTHSIVFGVAIGLIAAFLAPTRNLNQQVGIVLASVSHAPLDALVTTSSGKAAGVELLWPLTDYRFRLGLFDYFSFKLDPRFDPWADILTRLLKISLIELLVIGPLLLFVVFIKQRD